MTYLQMVNNILKRLRERTVSTVGENKYAALVGVLVNDAKREVEDAWNWSGIRTTLTATTEKDLFAYVLTSAGDRGTILEAINDTTNERLEYKDPKWFTDMYLLQDTVEEGEPKYWTYNGLDATGDTIVEVFPKPDGIYDLRFNLVLRTAELENDDDEAYIPVQPINLLAYAKAIEERGEDGGVAASSAYMAAQRSLADAISLDAQKNELELIWRQV
jgi:hypothetical protein